MLANGYSHCDLGQKRDSFSEFSNSSNGMKNFAYSGSIESDLAPIASALSLAPKPSYQEDAPVIADFSVDGTSPGTGYSSYSSTSAAIDTQSLIGINTPNGHDGLTKSRWPEKPLLQYYSVPG